MSKAKFDAAKPDSEVVRRVVFARLRQSSTWEQLENDNARGFSAFVEFQPPRPGQEETFQRLVLDVFWQLVAEGVLAPGKNMSGGNMQNLPWFHRTSYGTKVIEAGEYVAHDRDGYLTRLDSRIPHVDATVRAYLDESLGTFVRGNLLASMVMLGVAAERVFLLLCASLETALADATERQKFSRVLQRMSVKPKLDWVHDKLRRVEQGGALSGYPDGASVMVTLIYDLIRMQRNDLGHPKDVPPRPSRDEANAFLQIFPTYYERSEALRTFLGNVNI